MEQEEQAVKTAEALSSLESPAKEEQEQPKTETETSEKSEETPVEAKDQAPEEQPDAKAFQAMRKRIKELEGQLTSKTANVEPLVPNIESPAPAVQGNVNQTQFFDPTTGEFDVVGYQNAVRQEAMNAAQAVTKRQIEEERQTREAYAAYPELDPQNKDFNQDLYDATSAIILQSMVKGTNLTAKQAAEKALGLSTKALKEAADKGAQQQMEQITAKEQASLEATANSARAQDDASDLEDLTNRTRLGGKEGQEAIAERLRRSGF